MVTDRRKADKRISCAWRNGRNIGEDEKRKSRSQDVPKMGRTCGRSEGGSKGSEPGLGRSEVSARSSVVVGIALMESHCGADFSGFAAGLRLVFFAAFGDGVGVTCRGRSRLCV